MKKLDNIINNYKNNQENVSSSTKDAISELFALRKRALRLVDNANRNLERRKDELRQVNEMICFVKGHTFTDWKEHDGFLDRTWYYTRECEICGKFERVEDEPIEYRNQVLKRKK